MHDSIYVIHNGKLPSARDISEALDNCLLIEDWQNFGGLRRMEPLPAARRGTAAQQSHCRIFGLEIKAGLRNRDVIVQVDVLNRIQ